MSRVKSWLARQPMVSPVRQRVVRYRERMQGYDDRFAKQAARIESLQKKVDSWTLSASRSRVEFLAGAHQLTSFEDRLAALEATQVAPGDAGARAEARGIVEEMRAEHARVRARLTMLGAYEERLRRVETALLHAIKIEELAGPPEEIIGADVIEARRAGRVASDATRVRGALRKVAPQQ